jgi:hypothetical protein
MGGAMRRLVAFRALGAVISIVVAVPTIPIAKPSAVGGRSIRKLAFRELGVTLQPQMP